ncbi:unnamed protein product [Sympodiomycopsis kandeliae]
MDLSDYPSPRYNPQHPHSAAAAAAQARLRQRASFGPDHPPVKQPVANQRSNTFGSFLDDDPIGLASPATSVSGLPQQQQQPQSPVADRFLPRSTTASPASLSSNRPSHSQQQQQYHHQSPLHQASPLASVMAPSPASGHSPHAVSHSASPDPPQGGFAQLGRSSSTHFSSTSSSNKRHVAPPLARPPVNRSHTGGPLSTFSPFVDDDDDDDQHDASIISSPVDAHNHTSLAHRQSPLSARHALAGSQSASSSAFASQDDEFSRSSGPLRSSTAGPDLWGISGFGASSAAPAAIGTAPRSSTSAAPAPLSSSSAVDPWRNPATSASLGLNRHPTASPLVKELRLPPSRENSTSSDSGLWQKSPISGSPVSTAAFSKRPLRDSRGPPPRATTLASQHDIDLSHRRLAADDTSESIASEDARRRTELTTSPTGSLLPESLQAAVAVTMEPDELTQLQHSPMSALHNFVDDPEEDATGFGLVSDAGNQRSNMQQARSKQVPPRMQTRADLPLRFRAPQRATTLDPGNHLPRSAQRSRNAFGDEDGEDSEPLSPVLQDHNSPVPLRQSAMQNNSAFETGSGNTSGNNSTDSPANHAALRGLFDGNANASPAANPAASWTFADSDPIRDPVAQYQPQRANVMISGGQSPALGVGAMGLPTGNEDMVEPRCGNFEPVYHQNEAGYSQGAAYHENLLPSQQRARPAQQRPSDGTTSQQNQQHHLANTAIPSQFASSHPFYGTNGGGAYGRAQVPYSPQPANGHIQLTSMNHNPNGLAPDQLAAAMSGIGLSNRGLTHSQHPGGQALYASGNLYPMAGHAGPPPPYYQTQREKVQPYPQAPPPQQYQMSRYPNQYGYHPGLQQPNVPLHQFQGPQPHVHRGHHQQQQLHHTGPHHRPGQAPALAQSSSTGARSALLEDFRAKRSAAVNQAGLPPSGPLGDARRPPPSHAQSTHASLDATAHWSLDEVRGHIVEFCMDQHGSRFAQERLDSATQDQVNWVFEEIRPHARTLMQDVFGNYVVQKMFEYGSEAQRLSLTEEMRGHVVSLSLGTYGCRVMQKALDHLPNHVRLGLAEELEGHVLELIQDQNANHVVQKLLSVVDDPGSVKFISDAFSGKVLTLGAHCYSCRVLQRIFERCGEDQARPLLTEMHTGSSKLMADQYGNYVIQWILQRGEAQDQEKVIDSVVGNVLTLSRHKFASNVVEQVVRAASATQRRILAEEILQQLESSHQPHSAVLGDPCMTAANVMMTDQYANYVLQRFLELCEKDQKLKMVAILRPRLIALRRGAGGPGGWTKHLAAVERLVNEASGLGEGDIPSEGNGPPSSKHDRTATGSGNGRSIGTTPGLPFGA